MVPPGYTKKCTKKKELLNNAWTSGVRLTKPSNIIQQPKIIFVWNLILEYIQCCCFFVYNLYLKIFNLWNLLGDIISPLSTLIFLHLELCTSEETFLLTKIAKWYKVCHIAYQYDQKGA